MQRVDPSLLLGFGTPVAEKIARGEIRRLCWKSLRSPAESQGEARVSGRLDDDLVVSIIQIASKRCHFDEQPGVEHRTNMSWLAHCGGAGPLQVPDEVAPKTTLGHHTQDVGTLLHAIECTHGLDMSVDEGRQDLS